MQCMRATWSMGVLTFLFLLSCKSQSSQESTGPSSVKVEVEEEASMAAYSAAGQDFWIDRFEVSRLTETRLDVRQGLMPVSDVSFEDAEELCKERGLRICKLHEWKLACLGRAGLTYGYGASEEQGYCNVGGDQVEPAGFRVNCRSGSRVYDMVGNVGEWVFDERVSRPVVVGGSYLDGKGASCYSANYASPGLKEKDVGVRCCK